MNKRVSMQSLFPLISETLKDGREVIITVTGTSMLPLLRHGRDRVCIVKPPALPLKKHDLPLYLREDGKYILHRIVKVTPDGYGISGDNQCAVEYPVRHSQVIGVVKGIWRGNRYISCDSFLYMAYSRLRVALCPARRLVVKVRRFNLRANTAGFFGCRNGERKNEG